MLPIFVATNTYVSYTHKHLYWESLYQLLHLKKTLGFIPIIMSVLGIIPWSSVKTTVIKVLVVGAKNQFMVLATIVQEVDARGTHIINHVRK